MGNKMNPVSELETNLILESLHYDKDTGNFFWKKSRGNMKSGSLAGSLDGHGYICIQIGRRPHRAHNLAWMFHYGKWPEQCIDHINRNRSDNRICNLRDISFKDNIKNSPRSKSGEIDSIQIGGDHYKKQSYQHWNMVADTDLPYLLGCATKYVTRWKDKNGIQDLDKSIHYLEKADKELIFAEDNEEFKMYYELFYTQFDHFEKLALELIFEGLYEDAINLIRNCIHNVKNSEMDIDKEVKQSYWRG